MKLNSKKIYSIKYTKAKSKEVQNRVRLSKRMTKLVMLNVVLEVVLN